MYCCVSIELFDVPLNVLYNNCMIKDELEYLEFSNNRSHLKLTLQGAHIFEFQVKGEEPLLFLSETAVFKKGVPIRGGIPICWPWFGPHPSDKHLPNHGFARVLLWEYLSTEHISADKTKIILRLGSSEETLKFWPHSFELRVEILMSDILEVSLTTSNTGKDSFSLTQALHSYVRVDEISRVSLKGLVGCGYYNKVDDTYDNRQEKDLLFQSEVDRVYSNVTEVLTFQEDKQQVRVETKGSETVVVWNPGAKLLEKMPDLSSYKTMLCIESANTLDDALIIHPKQSHTLTTILSQV